MKPIGFVHSCFRDRFGTPRQPSLVNASDGYIQIRPEFQPEFSLEGLSEYSHLWVIFHFHQNTNKKFSAKVHPPRLNGESVGVFASRSPHRPNPIGLSLVKIDRIDGDKIFIRGHDLVDGTPVLDIKPYIKEIEAIPDARSSWVSDQNSKPLPQIIWSKTATENLAEFEKSNPNENPNQTSLKDLIDETIALDPRPNVYKGFEGQESSYRDVHAVRLRNVDVHFKFHSPLHVEIIEVRSLFR